MKKTEQKIIKFIDSQRLVTTGDTVLIAFSGGPDSVFLLNFLYKFKKRFKIEIAALHVNHMLRGKNSDNDEKFCEKMCVSLGIPFSSEKVDVKKYASEKKLSIEEAARNLRYEILKEKSRILKFKKIATGHNSNDNAETVLLNLFHGTGLSGISGIPITRGNIIRPMLVLTKEEILAYLLENNIQYRTDKSNKDENFQRNFIRHRIIPLIKENMNPSLEDTIFKSTASFKYGVQLLNDHIKKIIKKYVIEKNGEMGIDLVLLEKYPEEILGDLVKKIMEDKFGYAFSFADFLKIKGLVSKQTGRKEKLSDNLTAYRERDRILIRKEFDEIFAPVEIKLGDNISLGANNLCIESYSGASKRYSLSKLDEKISADNLDNIFILRRWKSGDRFKPLGMKNFKKVSDFLNEQKIPASQKKNQLILENRNNIVWVIGLRIDDRFKIGRETKKIWRLQIK